MSHAHVEGGEGGEARGGGGGEARSGGGGEARGADAGEGRGDRARQANLLGALVLTVADRLRVATEHRAGQGGSAPAALVSLAGYLDGGPIDSLRDPLGLTHSAVVRLVDRLSAAGLAVRREGPDRRSVGVTLTPEGSRAAAAALEARQDALETALAALDQGERAELARLHEKMLTALTDSRATAGHICRLCDAEACGHEQGRCPVTRGADAAERT
jgi:DNA-binding MarR family transcriptional regulator